MIKETFYSSVERIEYTFTESEIQKALMKYWELDQYNPSLSEIKFWIEEVDGDNDLSPDVQAKLVISFEERQDSPAKQKEQIW